MRIEIDQSWKIEKTENDTILAFSNKIQFSIRIRAADKKYLQKFFREYGESRLFVYKTFAALIFLLIEPFLSKITEVVIDKEYPGQEALIKGYIWGLLEDRTKRLTRDNIYFGKVDKKSKAHVVAYSTFVGKRKNNRTIGLSEILKTIVRVKP